MNSAKRSTELPKREVPVALPLKPGYRDGTSAEIVTDANDDAMGTFFGIKPGMTVEAARECKLTAEQFEKLEYMLNAINKHHVLVEALEAILLTTPGRRVTKIVTEALKASGELKE